MSPELYINDESLVVPFNGESVAIALSIVRELELAEFKNSEQEWLKKHNPSLHNVVEASFINAVNGANSYIAEPILFGKLFAHYAVRMAVERSNSDYQAVKQNVLSNIDAINASYSRGSSNYRGDLSCEEKAKLLLGNDVYKAVEEVKNVDARLDTHAMLLILLVRPSILENY